MEAFIQSLARLGRFLRSLPLVVVSPFLVLAAAASLAVADLVWAVARRRQPLSNALPDTGAASVVIPNWNGRDLLEKYLPSVLAALAANPRNEVIVVDNGSTDGSADFLRARFPGVKLLPLERNLGFGGGSNAGVRAAANGIVVLLNSDMRVAPDFLPPLLQGFTDEAVFAVSCQIFFSDPNRAREETGLTQGCWENGGLHVRHRIDESIRRRFPCFYGGGGSCAFDRRKFLELGGFDELFAPFYLEDTDLGYQAWKRGWKVYYEPRSVVWHEHRGTIGRRFPQTRIDSVLKKNFILFCWKNIHETARLTSHLFFTLAGAILSAFFGESPERSNFEAIWRAFLQLPQAVRSRWRARSLAVVDDTEAFRRPLGGYHRDRFEAPRALPEKLNVLFVSPYPICPPVHGGGVFMYQTLRDLGRLANVHLVALLDYPHEFQPHEELGPFCASMEFLLRLEGQNAAFGSIEPHAVREFRNGDLEWLIHRQIYLHGVDVVQLEYTNMAQYAGEYRRLVNVLFEHDIYFQSLARLLPGMRGPFKKFGAAFEYLRSLRYELRMLRKMDRVQVCTRENADYLISYLPGLRDRIDPFLRAGIDTSRYEFRPSGREPCTMLFLGSFRHLPNLEALDWFTRRVLPLVRQRCPDARLVVVGSDPPPRHSLSEPPEVIELHGFVEDVRRPLAKYAVFVCPVLSGSGVRVKLLEAFAAGIPAVSTRLGAEGLAARDGEFCRLADDPAGFAARIVRLFENPSEGAAMAVRARTMVETAHDMTALTRRLEASYRRALEAKRAEAS